MFCSNVFIFISTSVLQVGKQLVADAAEALKNAFYPQGK